MRALCRVANRTIQRKTSFRSDLSFTTFRNRTTNRSRTSVTATRGSSFLTQRVAFRISRTLYYANHRSTDQAMTKSTSNATHPFAATRNGSSHFTLSFRRTIYQTSDHGNLIKVSTRSRNISRSFSFQFVFSRIVTTLYVTQTHRFFFRIVRTRTIISTLLRSTTDFTIAFRGRSFFDTVLPDTMNDKWTYQTTTGSSGVVGLFARCTLPPLSLS